jgi:hypothetical protein
MSRRRNVVLVAALVLMGAGMAAWSEPAKKPAEATAAAPAASVVEALSPLVGTWQIEATWSWGDALRARRECVWGLNKQHLEEKIFVNGPNGEFQRYHSMYSFHKAKNALGAVTFVFDGSVKAARIEKVSEKEFRVGFTPWDEADAADIRSTLTFEGPDAYRWIAEARENGQWKQIMNGVWKRVK